MTKQQLRKLLLPIGLIALTSSFVVSHFLHVSPEVDDFLKGFGITLIFSALLARWFLKPTN